MHTNTHTHTHTPTHTHDLQIISFLGCFEILTEMEKPHYMKVGACVCVRVRAIA